MFRINLGLAAARDGASKTGMVRDKIGLPITLSGFGHRLTTDQWSSFKLNFCGISSGKCAKFIDHIHQHLSPIGGQSLAGYRILRDSTFSGTRCFHQPHGIINCNTYCASDCNSLEVFWAHYSANPWTSCCAVLVVDNGRKENPFLTSRTNWGHPDIIISTNLPQFIFGLPDTGAPQLRGILQWGLIVVDVEIDRSFSTTLKDNHIPAGILQFSAKKAPGIWAGDGSGQWAFSDHRPPPWSGRNGAGQRTCGKNHFIVCRERIYTGVCLFNKVFCCQPSLAQILSCPLHIKWFTLTTTRC